MSKSLKGVLLVFMKERSSTKFNRDTEQFFNPKITKVEVNVEFLGKFDVEDGVKLVAIVAISDFTKDYLIKQKIIPNNI